MVLHIFLFREAVSLEYMSQKWFLVSANFKICIISLLGKPVKHIVDSSCTTNIFVQANHDCDVYWLLLKKVKICIVYFLLYFNGGALISMLTLYWATAV